MTEQLSMLNPPALRTSEPSPLQLLQTAVDRGLDASQLAILVNLQRDLEADAAKQQFAAAMHGCQSEMPVVIRDAMNTKTQSRYAMLETVQRVVKPIYSRWGFSLCFGESDSPLPGHKRTVCDVTHSGGHERRYYLDLPNDGIGPKGNPIAGMNAVQGEVSTTSYGQRRLTSMIFNLTLADQDRDGNTIEETVSEEQAVTIREWLVASMADEKKFLNWLHVGSVAEIPASRFDECVATLKRKAKQ